MTSRILFACSAVLDGYSRLVRRDTLTCNYALVIRLMVACVLPSLAVSESARAQDPFALGVRETEPLTAEQELATFSLPPGFRIELVASEPAIFKPMNVAFDVRGRLWVTDSLEYPYAAPLDQRGRDSVKVLEDKDHDGKFETITTFADGLNIPIGVYPTLDGCIAWSIPNIWYLRDVDGDLKCDERIKLYGPMGWERDTHGMNNSFTRGFDGWLYSCHGFNNETRVAGRDGHEIHMQSGNTYRMRLDGERVEQFTWGQVNPFGMTIDAWGHLFTADCHSKPVYQLLRGGYYPSFGKPHDGLGFVPPIMEHLHGSTAIAGVTVLETDSVPEEWRNHLLSGNVMTSRINHNRLDIHGVTRAAIEQPDFMSTTDPWFRPVDIKLGPDGAIYVCDFYNRIIGHYEVPLTHPGRDRERGRLWRIWYDGSDANRQAPVLPNLAAMDEAQQVERLSTANLTERLLLLNLICDQNTSGLSAPLQQQLTQMALDPASEPHARVAAIWIMNRCVTDTRELRRQAAATADPLVLTHLLKILSEQTEWDTGDWSLAQQSLANESAEVQAAAVDAIAQRVQLPIDQALVSREQLLQRLIAGSNAVSRPDVILKHGYRIALKQLLSHWPEEIPLEAADWDTESWRELSAVCLAVPSAASADLLHQALNKSLVDGSIIDAWKHVATHARVELLESLIESIPATFASDLELQFDLMVAIERGLRERGEDPVKRLSAWGSQLATAMLQEASSDNWINEPIEGTNRSDNPWTIEKRRCSDENDSQPFLTTLASGESSTGALQSPSFEAGDRFVFWCAGHCGFPDQPFEPRNFLRLRDARTDEVLIETTPPRNDVAQRFEWETSDWRGKSVYFEAFDSDQATAYAWLSVGRFETEGLDLPNASPRDTSMRVQRAALLIAQLRLTELRSLLIDRLASSDFDSATTLAILDACTSLYPDPTLRLILPWITEENLPENWSVSATERLVSPPDLSSETAQEQSQYLLDTLAPTLDAAAQQQLAERALGSEAGVELLVGLWERGKLSTRLLAQQQFVTRVLASANDAQREKIATWQATLPAVNEQLLEMIQSRRNEFTARGGDLAQGQQLFTKHCAACHQIAGQGAVVGPQLDGIGLRGLERLTEDLFDPNRNVDVAFRQTLIETEDGSTLAGLIREESATTLTLIDNQGKEVIVDVASIVGRQPSVLSLMPETLAADIPEQEMLDLLAYLMSQKTARE